MASSHFLRLSLVSCPILLYPATSDAHDAETGVVVDADEIVKGYKAGEGYIEITDEDIDAIEVESTRTSMSTSSCRAPRSTLSTSTGPPTSCVESVDGTVPLRPISGLDQGQEPGQPGDDPGARGAMVTVHEDQPAGRAFGAFTASLVAPFATLNAIAGSRNCDLSHRRPVRGPDRWFALQGAQAARRP
jgi:hypothetical protein